VLWWHAATATARDVLPAVLAPRAGPPVTVGGLIIYRRGPVGPYREVFGSPVMLRGGLALIHVPFMAVDSPASVAGGRRNWALPKVEARFDGDLRPGGRVNVGTGDWALALSVTARPRSLPAWGAVGCAQVWPDGRVRRFSVRVHGRAALGAVHVEHPVASALGGWLRRGRHPAVLFSGTQHVSAPQGFT
jgi:hypothetical protein